MKKGFYTTITLTILSTLILLNPISAQNTNTNTNTNRNVQPCRDKHCVSCDQSAGCLKCIGRRRNATNGNYCDADISQFRCKVWADEPHNYCEQCDWWYVINERNQCVKSRIPGCVQGSRVGEQELCTVCENTLPNMKRTRCSDKLEIPNCKWGTRHGDLEICAYCDDEYSVYGYGCVPNCVHGCSQCIRKHNGTQWARVCKECDWKRDFYMTSENVCAGARVVKVLGVLLGLVLVWSFD